jgi:ubiquinone/menaquinone biosynthesis C-methylase UbiE
VIHIFIQQHPMVQLSEKRLASFGDRVQLKLTDGSLKVDVVDSSVDKFISNYVLDLLPPEEISLVVAEAHRVLSPGGYLCLVSLTHGTTGISQLVSWAWKQIHALRPTVVGGCRPIELLNYLSQEDWQILYNNVIATFGIPSEIVIACSRS